MLIFNILTNVFGIVVGVEPSAQSSQIVAKSFSFATRQAEVCTEVHQTNL